MRHAYAPKLQPARRPGIVQYGAYATAASWLSGYITVLMQVGAHAIAARLLSVRFYGFGLSLALTDNSLLLYGARPGWQGALTALAGVAAALALGLAAWQIGQRVRSLAWRIWLLTLGLTAWYGTLLTAMGDAFYRRPGAPLTVAAAAVGHAWPLALPLMLLLVLSLRPAGRDLARLGANLRSPGSPGFVAWALVPLSGGTLLRCLWLLWAAGLHRLPGAGFLGLGWLLLVAALAVSVARVRPRVVPRLMQPAPQIDAGIIAASLTLPLMAWFGLVPGTGHAVLIRPPAVAAYAAGTLEGALALSVGPDGTVKFSLDMAQNGSHDHPYAADLILRAVRDDKVAYWNGLVEPVLTQTFPGSAWPGLQAGDASSLRGPALALSPHYSGAIAGKSAGLTIATEAAGVRISELSVQAQLALVLVSLDARQQVLARQRVAAGTVWRLEAGTAPAPYYRIEPV